MKMKKLTSLIFFKQNSKEEDFKCFRGKINAKTRRKNLEEKMEELESPLSVQNKPNAHSRSPHNTCLARKRPTKKSKDALSAEACAKPEVSMKINLPSAYIRRRKQKKKTRSLITHALGLSLRENPLSLVIHHFLPSTYIP